MPPRAPELAASGPEALTYPHAAVEAVQFCIDEEKVFLFLPAQPTPASAGVLIFLHGWFATDPADYRAWIDHLCRRGWIVIFPEYQGHGNPMRYFTANAARSVKEALRYLYDKKRIEPNRDKCAVIGHEGGAIVGANLAAAARYLKLPVPGAVLLLMPSRRPGGVGDAKGIDLYDLSGIRAATRVLFVVGTDDQQNGMSSAIEMYYATDAVPAAHKNFFTLLSDRRGVPALIGDELAPLAPIEPIPERAIEKRRLEFVGLYPNAFAARQARTVGVDAMDTHGTWRLFDGLVGHVYDGWDGSLVLGEGPSARFMGYWSDGVRVNGLLVTKRP